MKAHVFMLVWLLVAGIGFSAQSQSDTTQVESKKKTSNISGYIGGVYEYAPVVPIHTNSFGIQAAVLIKSHWQLGFYSTRYGNNNYREELIFPNVFQMNYKHAGLILGYRTHLEKSFEFNLESKIGFGEVKWDQVETGNSFLADKFRMVHLQVSGDYLLSKFIALNGFAGYRWMTGLDITGLVNDDFEGLYYGIMVKLGIFQ